MLKSLLNKLPRQQNNNISDDSGINLFVAPENKKLDLTDYLQLRVNTALVIISVGIIVVFVLLFTINSALDTILNKKLSLQQALLLKLDSYSQVAIKSKEISDKTAAYKQAGNTRPFLSEKTDAVFREASGIKNLYYATVTHTEFTLSIEVDKAIDFAHLINRYLESGVIQEVSILSADYNPTTTAFRVELKGVFR